MTLELRMAKHCARPTVPPRERNWCEADFSVEYMPAQIHRAYEEIQSDNDSNAIVRLGEPSVHGKRAEGHTHSGTSQDHESTQSIAMYKLD